MVFQEPMTSLNPVLTIGRQLTETLEQHLDMTREQAVARAIELLGMVGISDAEAAAQAVSAPLQRRHAPARDDRHGAVLRAQADHRRRADHRARRDDPGADPRADEGSDAAPGRGADHHHPQSRHRRALCRPGERHVRRQDHRERERATTSITIPRHPYTLALLRSVPRMDRPRRARLDPVQGQPPDLAHLDAGCSFRPRCGFAVARCASEKPPLARVDADSHVAACLEAGTVAGSLALAS